jgi:diguanylate cyclase (GGDEF)-like protein
VVHSKQRKNETLNEQQQITEVDVSHRLELLDINSTELELLFQYKVLIKANIQHTIDQLFLSPIGRVELSRLSNEKINSSQLRTQLTDYVCGLFNGVCDQNYVNEGLLAGLFFKQNTLQSTSYLSVLLSLKTILIKVLSDNIPEPKLLEKTRNALDKIIHFEMSLVFGNHITMLTSEVKNSRKKMELRAKRLENRVAERTRLLEEQVNLDPLTNIYNTRAMQNMLKKELAMAKRRHTKLALVYFDVDHFKDINDTEGHVKGDEVLKGIGETLRHSIRETDIPCRYGGDEFCLILLECSALEAQIVCEKVIVEFTEKYPGYSFSIGIAETGSDEFVEAEELIQFADQKMYMAKKEDGFKIIV